MPQAEARQRARLLRLLLAQSRDYALLLVDPEGRVVAWLAGAEHVFGFTAGQMIGRPTRVLFTGPDVDRGVPEHELQVARATGRAEDDRWQVRNDGSLFWASSILMALRDSQGELFGFGKIVRDRSDVKLQADALESRARSLAQSGARKNAFLATVAHELRNPMSSIANAVEILRRTSPLQGSGDMLDLIQRQVHAMDRVLGDLLDLARLDHGKISLRPEALDLRRVAAGAAEAARPAALEKRQQLELLLIDGPVAVHGDPVRLEQVVVNLLGNAMKYTQAGGRIWLKLTTEGNEAVLRVEDTGIGMSAEILPRIFDLFAQEEGARALAPGGLGLGLPLVRQLVELHGGTVQARSDGKGKGSVFTVRLPLSP